jgi:hypothetical protein
MCWQRIFTQNHDMAVSQRGEAKLERVASVWAYMTQQSADSDLGRPVRPESGAPSVERVEELSAADRLRPDPSEGNDRPSDVLSRPRPGVLSRSHRKRIQSTSDETAKSHIWVRSLASIALVAGAGAVNLSTTQKDLRAGALAFVAAAALTLWGTLIPGLRRKIALRMTAIVAVVLGLVFATGTYFWIQRPLYKDDFKVGGSSWLVQSDHTGDSRYSNDGYQLSPKSGYAVWRTAPTMARPANVIVSATARLNGAGGWGVWCRGSSDRQVYEFSLTHARAAYIKVRPGDDVKQHLIDVDPTRFNTVEAQCEDVADDTVHLTMWVNRVKVAERYDNAPGVLGPGSSGLHAFGFGDLKSEPPEIVFKHFEVRDGAPK